MSQYQLCLLDCQSIQQYVFGSNKLRTNIGASENVSAIFEEKLKKFIGDDYQLDAWKSNSQKIEIFENKNMLVDIGYIGGGNALMIFRKSDKDNPAQDFVQKWSRQVLIDFPGIVPAAAIGNLFNKPSDGKITNAMLSSLFRHISVKKNQFVPITTLPRHGITAECKVTGLSVEKFDDENKSKKWVSSVNIAKTRAAATLMKKEFTDDEKTGLFKECKNPDYRFSHTEEKLGQTEAHNHIAIVHIDGNSMGNQFQQCKDLAERRHLSKAVENQIQTAWNNTALGLTGEMEELLRNKIIKSEHHKKYELLPLRKIILNGDDLTFACNAQLAFWLTEKLIEKLCGFELDIDEAGKPIRMSACAGIAIVKTKFPFYRAYNLAEELCRNAKTKAREKKESWLDFEIVYGGLSGNLKQIREKKYKIGNEELISRPWRVLDDKGKTVNTAYNDWGCLKNSAQEFYTTDGQGKSRWPRSKQKELLQRMARGIESFKDYELVLSARELNLPFQCESNLKDWQKLQFYYDTLQASEFYPDILLKGGTNG